MFFSIYTTAGAPHVPTYFTGTVVATATATETETETKATEATAAAEAPSAGRVDISSIGE